MAAISLSRAGPLPRLPPQLVTQSPAVQSAPLSGAARSTVAASVVALAARERRSVIARRAGNELTPVKEVMETWQM